MPNIVQGEYNGKLVCALLSRRQYYLNNVQGESNEVLLQEPQPLLSKFI
ncbi:MAG: hypothetical protein IJ632_06895 [Muribaculaceae bacterium]|nr:hypothetical protein [Muribaculaceae bacterium]